jgi:hypothetical protein
MSDFTNLSRDELEQRLRMAEDVCVMVGWCGLGHSDREEAATELWLRWARLVGQDYTGPDAHPELAGAEAALAAQRGRTRADTIARLVDGGVLEIGGPR